LLVRSGSFFFLFCLKHGLGGSVFAVRSPPYPGKGISDDLASDPIIRVLPILVLQLWIARKASPLITFLELGLSI